VLKLSCAAALKEVMSPAIVNENVLLATCRCLTTGWACIDKEKLSAIRAACSRQSLPSFAEGKGDLASSWRMSEQFSACEPSRQEPLRDCYSAGFYRFCALVVWIAN
jgi:hypothetical protein